MKNPKPILTAAVAAAAQLLGWKGVLLVCWVCAMLLDYLSGSLAAKLSGTWSSRIAREGVAHKAGMLLVVLTAALTDLALAAARTQLDLGLPWPAMLLPLVVTWYTLTEFGSILENAAQMGAPIPAWLTNGLKKTTAALNTQAEKE